VRYQSARGDDPLREPLRALAARRPRFGYRRLHVLLRREGWVANHKRVYRLYREERLAVRRKRRKKLAAGCRIVLTPPTQPHRMIEAWRIDYNEVRPHSALGNRTPTEYAARAGLAE
jgi:putative transposase